ncbi:MAG: ABC transporter permease [Acidobacteriota bacterium]
MSGLFRVFMAVETLAHREITRFVRQRSRVVGALLQPLVFWLLLGPGLQSSFQPAGSSPDVAYTEYFFPGILALALLFSAIFATISVVEDRKSGFLQGVLVAPVPRWSIVTGQALGSTVLAGTQAGLILLLAPVAGLDVSARSAAASLAVLALMGFALSGMGLLLAWRMDSTQGFHAIMNLLLLPMWLLSGAFFPAAGAPGWLSWVMALNPMTYGLSALRRSLYLGVPDMTARFGHLPPMGLSLAVVALVGLASLTGASELARRAAP